MPLLRYAPPPKPTPKQASFGFLLRGMAVAATLLLLAQPLWGIVLPAKEAASLPVSWQAPVQSVLQGNAAWAKKLTASKVKKDIPTITPKLQLLLTKAKSHTLFSFDEVKELEEQAQKLEAYTAQFPKTKELVEPMFLLAQIQFLRDDWFAAYNSFEFIITAFPESPYVGRCRYYKRIATTHLDAGNLSELDQPASDLKLGAAK